MTYLMLEIYSPTMISTRKKAKVRLNMLTSLHFFPEYLPSPRPSPAPILICPNKTRLGENQSIFHRKWRFLSVLTGFSCSPLLLCDTGWAHCSLHGSHSEYSPAPELTVCTQVASHVSQIITALK